MLPTTVLAKFFRPFGGDGAAPGIFVDEVTGRMIRLPVQTFATDKCTSKINDFRKNAVLVIAGTTGAILKMVEELKGKAAFPNGLTTPLLVVDEASMLAFPHFLALATLIEPNGEMLLFGDPRQLPPIVAHDWENEDRPTVEMFKPHLSTHEALDGLANTHSALPDEAIFQHTLGTHISPSRHHPQADRADLRERPYCVH